MCGGSCKRTKTKLGDLDSYSSFGRFTFASKADERCRSWSGLPVVPMKVSEKAYLLIHIVHSELLSKAHIALPLVIEGVSKK